MQNNLTILGIHTTYRISKMISASSLRSFLADFGMTYTLFSSLVVLFIAWYVKWRQSRKHLYAAAAKVGLTDRQTELPILGHSLYYAGGAERILRNFYDVSLNSSRTPFGMWLAHKLYFFITTPEQMETVLNSSKCIEKDDLYRFSMPLGGRGLFALHADAWKVHRKLIAPSFNQRILNQFVDVFDNLSNVLTDDVLSKKVGAFFDIEESVTEATIEAIAQSALGVKSVDSKGVHVLAEKFTRGFEIMFMRMCNVHLHFDFIFKLTNLSRDQNEIVAFFKSFIRNVFYEKKRDYIQSKKLEDEVAQIVEFKERKVFLDHLIEISQESNQLTDEDIIEEVQTFMIAGSDTSATTISFVLTCLGMFPECQQKVYDEIVDYVGLERDFESADLSKLKYLEKVVKETIRIFPVGPYIVRKITEDLEVDGHMLPKDSGLLICIFTMHRNGKYYPNPMKFDPERFSPEETAKRHPYAYIPFSAGPRNCIGAKFGITLVTTIVAAIVRKYFVETTYKSIEEVTVKQSMILKSCHGFPIKLTKRDGS